MPSAYLIPIYTNTLAETFVLVGQKEFISYKAVTTLREKLAISFEKTAARQQRERLLMEIVQGRQLIRSNGVVPGLDKRFFGTVLPAAGKPTFLGGHVKPQEEADPKAAAIREFHEEFDPQFQDKKTQELLTVQTLEEIYRESWGSSYGVYYAWHLTEEEKNYLHVEKLNDYVEHFERSVDLETLYQESNPEKIFLPEVRRLQWVSIQDLLNYFRDDSIDHHFLCAQASLYTPFILTALGLQATASYAPVFERHVIRHLLEHEPIDTHRAVASQLNGRPRTIELRL